MARTLQNEHTYVDYVMDMEQEHADRWLAAWDRLEALGVVSHTDSDMTLAELERIARYVKS